MASLAILLYPDWQLQKAACLPGWSSGLTVHPGYVLVTEQLAAWSSHTCSRNRERWRAARVLPLSIERVCMAAMIPTFFKSVHQIGGYMAKKALSSLYKAARMSRDVEAWQDHIPSCGMHAK